MNIPEDLRYSEDHEWVRLESEKHVRVGITDYAQDALGDVVFVELPTVGTSFKVGDVLGEVESSKSVSELFAPLVGIVVEVNDLLETVPEKINEDPYGEGWFCILEVLNLEPLEGLLAPDDYRRLIDA